MSEKLLNDLADVVHKCIRCGACRAVCPTFGEALIETAVARGRMALVEAVMEGNLELSPAFEKIIFDCALCGACKAGCPSGVDVPSVVEAARALLVKDKASEPAIRYLAKKSLKDKKATDSALKLMSLGGALYGPLAATPLGRYLPYQTRDVKRSFPKIPGRPLSKRVPPLSRSEGNKGRVAFYAGCVIFYVYPEMGESAVRVLNRAGYDVVFVKEEVCCGKPLKSLGEPDAFASLAEKNVELFSGLDVDAVVTACPTCALTLRDDYLKILPDSAAAHTLSAKVADINRFLLERSDVISLAQNSGETITYHDPCHLNFGMGVKEEPRAIIRASGELVEMPEPERCCGFGGSFSFLNYTLSGAISGRKAKNIVSSGASVLATACPGCVMHIDDALKNANSSVRAIHTVQLLDKALGHKGR